MAYRPLCCGPSGEVADRCGVVEARLGEHEVVALALAGSIPVDHTRAIRQAGSLTTEYCQISCRPEAVGLVRSPKPRPVGSTPTGPAK